VAVGHVPTSVWPGQRGTAVLSAHDVSYFVDAAHLAKGALIRYDTPCASYVFAVTGHEVVKAGTPVYNTAVPSLTLVTCWPTDALWFTPDRLLVTATEVQAIPRKTVAHPAVETAGTEAPPVVAVPPSLAAQGLTLATNSIPMGTMTISPSAVPAWVSSPGPLNVEASALEAFIGGIRALNQDHPAWFHSFAPGVAAPPALVGAPPPRYLSSLDVRIAASGDAAQSVVLTTTVEIPGGSAPGRYTMTVTASVTGSHLAVTGWRMQAG
jgi:sortase A